MRAFTTRVPRVAAALTGGAACAAAVALLAAPAASATPLNGLAVAQGLSFGPNTQYGTSCTYGVTVQTGSTGDVDFSVYKVGGGWEYLGHDSTTGPGTATVDWTPDQGPGMYVVQADSWFHQHQSKWIMVGNGVNLGSLCLVM